MKKFLFVAAFALLAWPCFAQNTNIPNTVYILFPGVPSGSCTGLMIAQNQSNADFYDCLTGTWNKVSGGGGGSGTVSGQASGVIPLGTSATVIGNQSHLDDGNTTAGVITSTEPFTSTGVIQSAGDGTHAGIASIVGNTTVPSSYPTNSFGFLGPNSASFTSYFFQCPATAPAATSLLTLAAVSSNVSACSFTGLQGTDSNVMTAGTVSGTASPLCTDANGGATTSGCPAGGGDTITSPNTTIKIGGTSSNTTLDTQRLGNTVNAALEYGMAHGNSAATNTTDLNNAIAAAQALKGGQVYIPADSGGTYAVNCLAIPNTGAGTEAFIQQPVRIYGDGFSIDTPDQQNLAVPTNGTVLSMNCNSVTAGGQIVTTGTGTLEIDHLAITQGSTPTTSWTFAGSTLTSIVVSANVGTVTTSTNHNLWVGAIVQVLGSATTALNQEYFVKTVPSGTTFTIATSGVGNATYTTGLTLSYTTPVIYTTNTSVLFHDNMVLGQTSLGGANNTQAMFVGGGTENTTWDTTLNSSFGGWQTKIYNNITNYIKQVVFLRENAAGISVFNNYGWDFDGSNDTNNGSSFELYGANQNVFTGNVVGGAYKYGVRVIEGIGTNDGYSNQFPGTDFAITGSTACFRFESTVFNNLGQASGCSTLASSDAAGGNNVINSSQTLTTLLYSPWTWGQSLYFPASPSDGSGIALSLGEYNTLCWGTTTPSSTCEARISQYGDGFLDFDTGTTNAFIPIYSGKTTNSGATGVTANGAGQVNASSPCGSTGSTYGTTAVNTGGTATTTANNCLPANSVIDAVVYRVTTAITTSASFTVGDGTIAARFCGTQSTLTLGATGICFAQADQTGTSGPRQVSAAPVVVTFNANPGAGAMRIIVYYHTWTAPTS